MNNRFLTTLIGFGKVAFSMSNDKKMAKFIKYQTHAQVLKSNKNFLWNAVVEPDKEKRELAKKKWKIPIVVDSISKLPQDHKIDVMVITTPPEDRMLLLPFIKRVKKAVILEKPISNSYKNSIKFYRECKRQKLKVQVNLFRRLDKEMIKVKETILSKKLGNLQAGFCVYGNGLYNNALHMVDLIRMLFGEISFVQAIAEDSQFNNCTMKNDFNIPFIIFTKKGGSIIFQPINFNFYRDIYLDFWGEKGRLEIFQEGLFYRLSGVKKHRAIDGLNEISIDKMKYKKTNCGYAYYNIYENLAKHLKKKIKLLSPIENAILSEQVLFFVNESKKKKFKKIKIED